MSEDKILDNANNCIWQILEYIDKNKIASKVEKQYPDLSCQYMTFCEAWVISALDFVMAGDDKVDRKHYNFINDVCGTDYSTQLNAAASELHIDGVPFDPSVVPAFLLLAEEIKKGSVANLYIPLADLFRCACAWDGERTPKEIARLEDVLEPIRQRFGIDPEMFLPLKPYTTNIAKKPKGSKPKKKRVGSGNKITLKQQPNKALAELDALIGLTNIKKEVRDISNLAHYLILRKNAGLPTPAFSMHMVFTGNPGTGKTTVARLIAEIYRDIGILESGHLVEVDRAGLVAKYTGQTAIKTRKAFMKAKDGVLFIDEAYALNSSTDGDDEFGNEAIATLLKLMEDHRDDVIVIVAGYTNEMEAFINANVGLKSRFTRNLTFKDYSDKELTKIFIKYCHDNRLTINKPHVVKVYKSMQKLLAKKENAFGNAREVRTFFEQTMQNQANRLASINNPTSQQLQELEIEDIPG